MTPLGQETPSDELDRLRADHEQLVTLLGFGGETTEDDKSPADTVARIIAKRNTAEGAVAKLLEISAN